MLFESIFAKFVSRLLLNWKFLGKAAPLRLHRARQVSGHDFSRAVPAGFSFCARLTASAASGHRSAKPLS